MKITVRKGKVESTVSFEDRDGNPVNVDRLTLDNHTWGKIGNFVDRADVGQHTIIMVR